MATKHNRRRNKSDQPNWLAWTRYQAMKRAADQTRAIRQLTTDIVDEVNNAIQGNNDRQRRLLGVPNATRQLEAELNSPHVRDQDRKSREKLRKYLASLKTATTHMERTLAEMDREQPPEPRNLATHSVPPVPPAPSVSSVPSAPSSASSLTRASVSPTPTLTTTTSVTTTTSSPLCSLTNRGQNDSVFAFLNLDQLAERFLRQSAKMSFVLPRGAFSSVDPFRMLGVPKTKDSVVAKNHKFFSLLCGLAANIRNINQVTRKYTCSTCGAPHIQADTNVLYDAHIVTLQHFPCTF